MAILLGMSEEFKMALESIDGLTVQLLTLSTGIITITITFIKNFIEFNPKKQSWIKATWVGLLLSILFGVIVKMSITGHIVGCYDSIQTSLNLYSFLQILFFFLSILSLIIFGLGKKS